MSFIMASFSLCDNVVIVVLQTFAAAKLQQIFEIHKDFTVKIKFICIFSRKACYFLFASFAGERIIIRQIRLSASALHEPHPCYKRQRPARSATLRAGCAIGHYSPHGNPPSFPEMASWGLITSLTRSFSSAITSFVVRDTAFVDCSDVGGSRPSPALSLRSCLFLSRFARTITSPSRPKHCLLSRMAFKYIRCSAPPASGSMRT